MTYAAICPSLGDISVTRIIIGATCFLAYEKERAKHSIKKEPRQTQMAGTINVCFWMYQRIAKVKHSGEAADRL